MSDGYESKCPKCYTPVEKIKRVYHKRGDPCAFGNGELEHVDWICTCGYTWVSYPR